MAEPNRDRLNFSSNVVAVIVSISALVFAIYGKSDEDIKARFEKKLDISVYRANMESQGKTLDRLDISIKKLTEVALEEAELKGKLMEYLTKAEEGARDKEERIRKLEKGLR